MRSGFISGTAPEKNVSLLYDPQTNGPLLLSVAEKDAGIVPRRHIRLDARHALYAGDRGLNSKFVAPGLMNPVLMGQLNQSGGDQFVSQDETGRRRGESPPGLSGARRLGGEREPVVGVLAARRQEAQLQE